MSFSVHGQDQEPLGPEARRHKEKIREAIRKNIPDIIAEQSVIGKSGDTKIKVPIRGIKEPHFIFGSDNSGVAQGDGKIQRGQVVGKKQDQGQDPGKAGDQAGEDVYETEVDLMELTDILFEDLKLPNMAKKALREILSKSETRRHGYRKQGIRPRLSLPKSAIERIKRQQSAKSLHGEIPKEQKPFFKEDLRYHYVDQKPQKESNAVVFCIMDTSGSMDIEKKFLAKSFFFLLYQFLRYKYQNVEIVFISHDTEAHEVDEDAFFHKGESGGTCISSGLNKALEIIEERYSPATWNIYAFHCSDGDNSSSDNDNTVASMELLSRICNMVGYGEIKPGSSYRYESSMIKIFKEHIKEPNFRIVTIKSKDDIWNSFKEFLSEEVADLGGEK